jgi:hypothetical protein
MSKQNRLTAVTTINHLMQLRQDIKDSFNVGLYNEFPIAVVEELSTLARQLQVSADKIRTITNSRGITANEDFKDSLA